MTKLSFPFNSSKLYTYEYKLSTERYAEMGHLKAFYQFLGGINASGRNIARLDTNEVNTLKAIAENPETGKAAQNSQNALCFHYSICYDAQGQQKCKTAPRDLKPSYAELAAK